MKKIEVEAAKVAFNSKNSPLVHCITNDVTIGTMANALLYVNAQPIMTNDVREFSALFKQTDSLLLNLGSLSEEREKALLTAAQMATTKKPFVVDIVGAASAPIACQLSQRLGKYKPNVIKGNASEMRSFCGLKTSGKGVDSDVTDQSEKELQVLIKALKQKDPAVTYLVTGKKDVVVSRGNTWVMGNGVNELARFTGSGDILGALVAVLLAEQFDDLSAVLLALSYLNICGEYARKKLTLTTGLADFRHETLNQLSLLAKTTPNWFGHVKGENNASRHESIFGDCSL